MRDAERLAMQQLRDADEARLADIVAARDKARDVALKKRDKVIESLIAVGLFRRCQNMQRLYPCF